MNPSKYAFQAGLFILLSIVGAILLVAQVAESRSKPTDAKTYTAVFAAGEDIAGLAPGAEVRLMGVKVGRVESVKVVTPENPQDDASIHVGFVVGNGVELRQTGAKVELQTAVTGGAWLNILSVGRGEALAEGGQIPAKSTNLVAMVKGVSDEMKITLAAVRGDLNKVSSELVATTNSIEKTAESANKLIEGLDGDGKKLIGESRKFVAEATGVMTDIRGVFGDSGDDIRTTLAKLSSLTKTLDKKLPESLDKVAGLVTKAEKSIDGVDELLTELTKTAGDARKLIAENRSDIKRTIASARRSVDELEGLVDDLRANPSTLLWPPDKKDRKNQDLYAAARSYAKAAENLESAAGALLAASKNDKTDPETLEALRENLMTQFKYFDKLQKEVWSRFEK